MTLQLLSTLEVRSPELTPFWVFNLVLLIICAAGLAGWSISNIWRLARPAWLIAIGGHILYQWPLLLFSNVIEQEMPSYWWFACVIHLTVVCSMGWTLGARKLNYVAADGGIRPERNQNNFRILEYGVLLLLFVAMAGTYLNKVPFKCTALYALFSEPSMALLAREFSIKLVGASAGVYAYGVLGNVVAPMLITIAAVYTFNEVKNRNFLASIISPIVVLVAIALVLLSGAKGMLIPSALVSTTTVFLLGRRLLLRCITTICMVALLISGILAFELIKDRFGGFGDGYDFEGCSVSIGVCDKSIRLVESLKEREMSLGLSLAEVHAISSRLYCACYSERPETDCAAETELPMQELVVGDAQPQAEDSVVQEDTMKSTKYVPPAYRYASALFYRIIVTPFQVASWHYLYVIEYGSPGIKSLPLARHYSDEVINMPELVYQRYTTIYSGGDKTATGTAPTSFLLAYPAYCGIYGLVLSILGVIFFDFAASTIISKMRKPLVAAGSGLMMVNSFNFLISDYLTVLISHGAFSSLLLLGLLLVLDNRGITKRYIDIIGSIILLVVSLPLMIVISLAIRIKLGGPILFRHMRPGMDGEPFELIKFRTMTDKRDAEGNLADDHERITRFGQFLRSTSLDELPELINVLKGDMSLVGPRPLLMEYMKLYNRRQARRHSVKPGITGWAQIHGRNAISWDRKFELDLWYIDNHSIWLDFKILAMTLGYTLRRKEISQAGHVTSAKFNPHAKAQSDDRE